MGVKNNKVTNANVYLNGRSFLGRAASISLPLIKSIDSDHDALGMFAKVEYAAGIDKMETDIKWNSFYKEVLEQTSDIYTSVPLQVRTHIETYEGGSRVEETPVVIYLNIRPKEIPLGSFEQQTNVDLTGKFAVTYIKIELDGVNKLEIDAEANIYKVNGADRLAAYRASLGI